MRRVHLDVLNVPTDGLVITQQQDDMIREASLSDPARGAIRIKDGIVYCPLGIVGSDDDLQKELDYQHETGDAYRANRAFLDETFIAGMPESMVAHKPHTANFAIDFPALLRDLPIGRGSYVLDVGTGTCWTSRMLAAISDHVFALDVTDDPHFGLGAGTIQFRHHNCYFERVLARMEDLPFRDRVFDFAFFNASFHHTADMTRTCRELARVLKPGGAAYLLNEEARRIGRSWDSHSHVEGGHHELDLRVLRQMATRLGLEVSFQLPEHHRRRPLIGRLMARAIRYVPLQYFTTTVIILTRRR